MRIQPWVVHMRILMDKKSIKVKCSYKGCGDRRIHWGNPDELKGKPTEFMAPPGHKKYYCSIECQAYDGNLEQEKK